MSSRARHQFAGVAGEFYVAYDLARKGLHAALTSGNALSVDVIVSLPNGEKAIALQVKTARHARHSPKDRKFKWRAWDVGRVKEGSATLTHPGSSGLWYALVDLQESTKGHETKSPQTPLVFLVPSSWVRSFVKPKHKRGIFCLPESLWSGAEHRWNSIERILQNDPDVIRTASEIPEALRTLWNDKHHLETNAVD